MRLALSTLVLLLFIAPQMGAAQARSQESRCRAVLTGPVSRNSLRPFARCLPSLRARLRAQADSLADTAETTLSISDAAAFEGRGLRPILYRLAALYPGTGRTTSKVVDSALASQLRWLSFVSQPDGEGRSGTISQIDIAMSATSAIADMIRQLVIGLLGSDPDFDTQAWLKQWDRAGHSRHSVP